MSFFLRLPGMGIKRLARLCFVEVCYKPKLRFFTTTAIHLWDLQDEQIRYFCWDLNFMSMTCMSNIFTSSNGLRHKQAIFFLDTNGCLGQLRPTPRLKLVNFWHRPSQGENEGTSAAPNFSIPGPRWWKFCFTQGIAQPVNHQGTDIGKWNGSSKICG